LSQALFVQLNVLRQLDPTQLDPTMDAALPAATQTRSASSQPRTTSSFFLLTEMRPDITFVQQRTQRV